MRKFGLIAKEIGIEKISLQNNLLEIVFKPDAIIDGGKLFKIAYKVNEKFTFQYLARKIIMKLNIINNEKLERIKTSCN